MTERGLEASVRRDVGPFAIDIELDALPGDIVAVVGPNGAGKTSLMRALAGLDPLTDGRVRLDGTVLEDVAGGVRVAPEQRGVGLCFQEGALFPHLGIVENVAFGPRRRGESKRAAHRSAEIWLDRLGLGSRLGARPMELSGGERQRVALARALVTSPRLLLLDEPLAALDASTRPETRRMLRRQLHESDAATVLVTHDPLEAMTMASRLVVMEQGRVVQRGTPEEITGRPRSRYVADLVGVNLFVGRATAGQIEVNGGGTLVAPGIPVGEVFAAVHPRAVTLYQQRPEGSPRNVWDGVVDDIDREGDRARVRVAGVLPIVSEVTAAAVVELGLAPGKRIWVSVKATEIGVYQS